MDDHDHGTHVAGTIGAVGNNGVGVAGVNWTRASWALKFLDAGGSGSTADAIKAIEFAIQAKAAFSAPARTCACCRTAGAAAASRRRCSTRSTRPTPPTCCFVGRRQRRHRRHRRQQRHDAPLSRRRTRRSTWSAWRQRRIGTSASFSNYGATTVHLARRDRRFCRRCRAAAPTPCSAAPRWRRRTCRARRRWCWRRVRCRPPC